MKEIRDWGHYTLKVGMHPQFLEDGGRHLHENVLLRD
jgi:hypothetical protein